MSISRSTLVLAIFAILAIFIRISLAAPASVTNITNLTSGNTVILPNIGKLQRRDCKPVCVKTPNPRECVTDCVNNLHGFLDFCRGFRIECDAIDLEDEEGRKRCTCECRQLMGEQIECPKVAAPKATDTETRSASWTETGAWTDTATGTETVPTARLAAPMARIHRREQNGNIGHAMGNVGVSRTFPPQPIASPTAKINIMKGDFTPENTHLDLARSLQCQEYMKSCHEDKTSVQCKKDCPVTTNGQSADRSHIEISRTVPDLKTPADDACVLPESELYESSQTVDTLADPRVPIATHKPNAADVENCAEACNKGGKKWYPQPGGVEDCNIVHGDPDKLPCAQLKCQNDCMMNGLFWWRRMCHLEFPKLTERECNAKIGFFYIEP